jgi:hypothetical protein
MMNCKENQLAWIVVPPIYHGTGVEEISGHVVKTVQLVSGHPEAMWRIDPPQWVTFRQPVRDFTARTIDAGDRRWSDILPDSWLRPFDAGSMPTRDEARSTRPYGVTA